MEEMDRLADFLDSVKITDVIPNLDKDGFAITTKPCPMCGEFGIYVDSDRSYQCLGCDHWGTGGQYLAEREGFALTEVVDEIARRANRPPPLEIIH